MSSKLLSNVKLHYPSAREWMWDYCVYLGGYTDTEGDNYDLGVYIGVNGDVSAAIVFGDEPGQYYSGPLVDFANTFKQPYYLETLKRAVLLELI